MPDGGKGAGTMDAHVAALIVSTIVAWALIESAAAAGGTDEVGDARAGEGLD